MSNVLIVYSTTDGQTRRIAERLQQVIGRQGHSVAVASMRDDPDVDLGPFDVVVVGASVRYGAHGQHVQAFIGKNAHVLAGKRNAFFSVNLIARNPEKRRPEANKYLQRFLREIAWKPQQVAVFAGKLDYPRYGFFDRVMIQLIMRMTKGPTDPTTVIEYTDWTEVERFASEIASGAGSTSV